MNNITEHIENALCHFDLTAKENNLNVVFEQNDTKIESDAEYIAFFRLV